VFAVAYNKCGWRTTESIIPRSTPFTFPSSLPTSACPCVTFQSCCSVHSGVGTDSHVINFGGIRCFWVFDVSQRGLKKKTTVGGLGKHRHSYHQPFALVSSFNSRSQWPFSLRRGPAAARLLGLRVRIPPGKWILSLVNVVYCQVEASALGWSRVQRSSTECGVQWVWSWCPVREGHVPGSGRSTIGE
jgi:hypothetical protein